MYLVSQIKGWNVADLSGVESTGFFIRTRVRHPIGNPNNFQPLFPGIFGRSLIPSLKVVNFSSLELDSANPMGLAAQSRRIRSG